MPRRPDNRNRSSHSRMRVCGEVRARGSCLMTPNTLMLIADNAVTMRWRRGGGRGERRGGWRSTRVPEETRDTESALVCCAETRRSRCGRAGTLDGGHLLIERKSVADRASSPSALNEVTCSLAYGDANRTTISPVYRVR